MFKNLFLNMITIIRESKVEMRDIPTDIIVTLQNMKYRVGWKSSVTSDNTLNTECPVIFVPLCMWKTLNSVKKKFTIFWHEWLLCIDLATALCVFFIPLMSCIIHRSTTLDLHSLHYGTGEYRYGGGCLSPRHSLHCGSVVRVYKAGV